jgi:hypothetical protein
MARRKKQAKSAVPYVQRLAEDEYVQEHLRNVVTRLRHAYDRVSRQRGKAAEDKKLYGHLREAATSARKATLALQRRRPEPEHRGRKALLVALAGGGAAIIISRRRREKREADVSRGPAATRTDAPQQTAPAATA